MHVYEPLRNEHAHGFAQHWREHKHCLPNLENTPNPAVLLGKVPATFSETVENGLAVRLCILRSIVAECFLCHIICTELLQPCILAKNVSS